MAGADRLHHVVEVLVQAAALARRKKTVRPEVDG
jgi:hypothetical protein